MHCYERESSFGTQQVKGNWGKKLAESLAVSEEGEKRDRGKNTSAYCRAKNKSCPPSSCRPSWRRARKKKREKT